MQIEKILKKDINRDIQGVIKIGNYTDESVAQELEEYVVTKELQTHFQRFFQAYAKSLVQPTDKIGVWISGFFGSGKSHFLKILSYLLDSNRQVHSEKTVSYFKDKIQDEKLFSLMKDASNVSSEVILFNIDSKSEMDSRQNKQAIVQVFNKVFNEMRGYSASIPWLAILEETLDKNGEYATFKKSFEEHAGLSWEESRDELYYNMDEAVKALENATGMTAESARSWLNKGEENYSISVESFVTRVKNYIDKQEGNYRLIFAVDELGQFIADNVQLMLNLQTLVEDLGKVLQGRVWVIVTSQQDIDSMKRNMSVNDFSKIQGRFNTLLGLSSANADEVIKKRLLGKTEAAEELLELTFIEHEAVLKNQVEFENAAEMATYKNAQDFTDIYPFIPYQFQLLQKVFTAIREHGSAGKHLADGERNLLEAVQQATIFDKHEDVGKIISFDIFYESIDQALEHSVRAAIIRASQNEHLQQFDVQVLKVLFLIRHVNELPATLKNVTTLFINNIEMDILALSKKIKASLIRLEDQCLIERLGNRYLFLTNEEQDVNREINRIQISTADLVTKVGTIFYDDILNLSKYTYQPFENSKQVAYEFPIATWIDERSIGKNIGKEIGMKIITMYSELRENEEFIGLSMAENNLILVLPNHFDFEYQRQILKIEAYIYTQMNKTKTPVIENIIHKKTEEARHLREKIMIELQDMIADVAIYANGVLLELGGTGVTKIRNGLAKLVEQTFSKLTYMKYAYSYEDLVQLLQNKQINLIHENIDDQNELATQEIVLYLQMIHDRHIQVTLAELIDRYAKIPYGWKTNDIIASLIHLFKREKIICLQYNERFLLNDPNMLTKLTKRSNQDKITVQIREDVPLKYIQAAKDVALELFNIKNIGDREDAMQQNLVAKLEKENAILADLLLNYKRCRAFPGQITIDNGKMLLTEILSKTDTLSFFNDIYENYQKLSDYAEQIRDIKAFFEGVQEDLFMKSYNRLQHYKADYNYINDPTMHELMQQIEGILEKEEPYAEMKRLPDLLEIYQDKLVENLELMAAPILESISSDWQDIMQEIEASPGTESLRRGFEFKMSDLKEKVQNTNQISLLIGCENESERIKLNCIQELKQLKKEQEKSNETVNNSINQTANTALKEAQVMQKKERIMYKKNIFPRKIELFENESEIKAYTNKISKELIAALEEVDIIKLI
ncbi:BREX system P-loop protein BrxC [Listeria booriae]|uniref:BREX system P-loop protein BrxC n=1 Tax=Listeria booriae TaxID=1552123 RepID=UPI0016246EB0|nr:BREX system P-loop protein BrxC [Listeria booriae]MBC1335087.1 BREX system P-loop protein BrxC [Listeria booriae]MBC1946279.1 BREX system P-loop protein BrxC [Listeria booriae]MBC6127578.1 BREX system P-loop protein BrxC [Listeria booriae]